MSLTWGEAEVAALNRIGWIQRMELHASQGKHKEKNNH